MYFINFYIIYCLIIKAKILFFKLNKNYQRLYGKQYWSWNKRRNQKQKHKKPETIQQNNINSINNADTQEVKPIETPIKFLIDSTSNNISTESNRNKIYAKNTQSQINNN